MPIEVLQEIADLLKKTFVFELKFKKEVFEKAKNLSQDKLADLKNILTEVGRWQEKIIEKILKDDPKFFDKVVSAKRKAEEEIIDMYRRTLEENDRKKMETILNKIKSL